VTLVLAVRAEKPVADFVFGLGLFSADGHSVYGTNTSLEDYVSQTIEGEGEVRIVLEDLRLVEGTYLVDVAAHRRDGTPYDYHRGLLSFRMKSRLKDVGVYRPHHRFEFAGGVELTPPVPRGELDLAEADRGEGR
jgi:homopolymeric O-antigen transport system ATP-binding protein